MEESGWCARVGWGCDILLLGAWGGRTGKCLEVIELCLSYSEAAGDQAADGLTGELLTRQGVQAAKGRAAGCSRAAV